MTFMFISAQICRPKPTAQARDGTQDGISRKPRQDWREEGRLTAAQAARGTKAAWGAPGKPKEGPRVKK